MKDVNEHDHVKAAVGIRNISSVEGTDRNVYLRAKKRINALNFDFWLLLLNEAVDSSVATTNVKNARTPGNQAGEVLG